MLTGFDSDFDQDPLRLGESVATPPPPMGPVLPLTGAAPGCCSPPERAMPSGGSASKWGDVLPTSPTIQFHEQSCSRTILGSAGSKPRSDKRRKSGFKFEVISGPRLARVAAGPCSTHLIPASGIGSWERGMRARVRGAGGLVQRCCCCSPVTVSGWGLPHRSSKAAPVGLEEEDSDGLGWRRTRMPPGCRSGAVTAGRPAAGGLRWRRGERRWCDARRRCCVQR
jgi:hypothetical protein